MKILTTFLTIFFSLLAVAIMTYISMATPIGPWIETTIVLFSTILFYFLSSTHTNFTHSVGLTTSAAGIGGILATGFGFSLPALYFTDPVLFKGWIAHPFYFFFICAGLGLAAGSLGFVIADHYEDELIHKQQLPFPIGDLIYKTIFAENGLRQALELFVGFIGVQLLLFVNTLFAWVTQTVVLLHKHTFSLFSLPEISITLDQFPLYLSIGFVTGHVIAIPLIAGFLVKTFCIDPLFHIYANPHVLHNIFFPFGLAHSGMNLFEFTLAFGSGIVLYGTFTTFFNIKKTKRFLKKIQNWKNFSFQKPDLGFVDRGSIIKIALMLLINICFFSYFKFGFFAQLAVIIFTAFCIVQMLIIAGQIGIVPLGRFATFVMVPGILLLGFSSVQAVLVATFVEVSGGVAADVLFGRKCGQLAKINKNQMKYFQLLGLVVSCVAVGVIFWLFASTFNFDACGLPVVKAASRALLINIKNFDMYILFLGFVSGIFLKFTKINPALLLGGILMPPSVSIMLIVGGLAALMVKDREKYYPLLSGISAGCVIWILIQAVGLMLTRFFTCPM